MKRKLIYLLLLVAITTSSMAQSGKTTQTRIENKRLFYVHEVVKGQTLYGLGKLYSVPVDTIIKYNDPCNILHNEWHNPWNPSIPRTDSIFDLINKTMPTYLDRIDLYMKSCGYITLNAFETDSIEETNQYLHYRNRLLSNLSDLSYLSGLPIE